MATVVEAIGARGYAEARAQAGAVAGVGHTSVGKNLLLFLAAPFIGLAYFIGAPIVGTVVMIRMAVRALL